MKDLYKRLKVIGFDSAFVRSFFLPDWWEDDLATVPANRGIAEMAIARQLGIRLDSLRDPEQALSLPAVANFRLKRNKGTDPQEVLAALHVAQRAARLIAGLPPRIGDFCGPLSAHRIREAILARDGQVELRTLLRFCWDNGVIVLHLAELPAPSKKFDGVAMFCGDRPVIVLASTRKGFPWLAFHLAHEMGHVFSGHVGPGDSPLVDGNLGEADDDQHEKEADDFGRQVLTGRAEVIQFEIAGDLQPEALAKRVVQIGSELSIDPGTVALCHARCSNKWPVAQLALKHLGVDEGAHRVVAEELRSRLQGIEIPAASERFMEILSNPV